MFVCLLTGCVQHGLSESSVLYNPWDQGWWKLSHLVAAALGATFFFFQSQWQKKRETNDQPAHDTSRFHLPPISKVGHVAGPHQQSLGRTDFWVCRTGGCDSHQTQALSTELLELLLAVQSQVMWVSLQCSYSEVRVNGLTLKLGFNPMTLGQWLYLRFSLVIDK